MRVDDDALFRRGEVVEQGAVGIGGDRRAGGRPAPQRVAGRRLDLHDVGATVREQLRGVGARDPRRQVDDAQARQRRLHWAGVCRRPDWLSRHSGGKRLSLSLTAVLSPASMVSDRNVAARPSTSSRSRPPIDSSHALSRLPMYSPWCCFITLKKIFCMNTVSLGRVRAHASAYFSTSASSWSRGTTLFTKLHSYIC